MYRRPDCHPERAPYAKGLCKPCYKRAYDAAHREEKKASQRAYRAAHPSARLLARRAVRRQDPLYRLKSRVRARVSSALVGRSKSARTMELLACTIEELWAHLERQFKPGMTRENYGEWHVDHIIPLDRYDLADPEQQRRAFHWSNTQPLWASENISKGAAFDPRDVLKVTGHKLMQESGDA